MAQKLSNLANKSKVKFGSLYGSPIVWIVADKNHAGYPSNSVTLVTNQIIKMLCFDATEPSNGNSDRRNYGNNRYIYSNLRQWLNSPAAAGQWYTAQHSADQTPDSSHVWNSVNPYSGLAGFLNAFTANERAALLNTTITVGKSSTDGGGTETCTDKIFPLSCTEVGLSGDHVCGSKLAIFSDNNSRIATVTASCVANSNYSSNPGSGAACYYLLRDAYAGSASDACSVSSDGSLNWDYAYNGLYGLRPACNLSSDLLISDSVDSDGCYTVIYNQAPTAPSTINVPVMSEGQAATISWGASSDSDGNLSGYKLERQINGGSWTQIYQGSARSYTDTPQASWTTVNYRVRAYDSQSATSGYRTGTTVTVSHNSAPVISGTDGALGTFGQTPPGGYSYTVTDADGDAVTVTEALDGTVLRTYQPVLGETNVLSLSTDQWLTVLNGSHTITITADDGKGGTAVRTLTLTKSVTELSFYLWPPLESTDMASRAIESIVAQIPDGAESKIEVCNNAYDAEPAWQDVTQIVARGDNIVLKNTTKTADKWGYSVRVTIRRNGASGDCYVSGGSGYFD